MATENRIKEVEIPVFNRVLYLQGRNSFNMGYTLDKGPPKSICWMTGWLDARTKERLGYDFQDERLFE